MSKSLCISVMKSPDADRCSRDGASVGEFDFDLRNHSFIATIGICIAILMKLGRRRDRPSIVLHDTVARHTIRRGEYITPVAIVSPRSTPPTPFNSNKAASRNSRAIWSSSPSGVRLCRPFLFTAACKCLTTLFVCVQQSFRGILMHSCVFSMFFAQ